VKVIFQGLTGRQCQDIPMDELTWTFADHTINVCECMGERGTGAPGDWGRVGG
jgi:hypothetical protein